MHTTCYVGPKAIDVGAPVGPWCGSTSHRRLRSGVEFRPDTESTHPCPTRCPRICSAATCCGGERERVCTRWSRWRGSWPDSPGRRRWNCTSYCTMKRVRKYIAGRGPTRPETSLSSTALGYGTLRVPRVGSWASSPPPRGSGWSCIGTSKTSWTSWTVSPPRSKGISNRRGCSPAPGSSPAKPGCPDTTEVIAIPGAGWRSPSTTCWAGEK